VFKKGLLQALLKAPAKLNLGLRIVGVRNETEPNPGYHEIESLFTPVSIFDELQIIENSKDEINFSDSSGNKLELKYDSITKSLDSFRKLIGPVPFLKIDVKKEIPIGAGMGGGSSDSGVLLSFLKARYAPTVSQILLTQCALHVGADVPFFLQLKPALVSGIGEVVQPLLIEKMAFLIIQPNFQISTKEAYSWYDEERGLTRRNTFVNSGKINEVSGSKLHGSEVIKTDEIVKNLFNDFEESVEKRHPEISMMKKALRVRGALGNLMSGTGSSVYGIFGNLAEAVSVRESLQTVLPSSYVFFICETLQGEHQWISPK